MNQRQKKMVIRIIENDCAVQGEYVNKDNRFKTCAIGALALAAGCTRIGLMRCNADNILYRPTVARRIRKRFGLTHDDLRDIQILNDSPFNDTVARRRADIIKFIKTKGAE